MKKIIKEVLFVTIVLFNIIGLVFFTSFNEVKAEMGGGNPIDCYSTFQTSGTGDQYTVTDCGPCTSKLCYGYSDKGTCRKPTNVGSGTGVY